MPIIKYKGGVNVDAELHDYLSRVDYVVLGAGNRRGRGRLWSKTFP